MRWHFFGLHNKHRCFDVNDSSYDLIFICPVNRVLSVGENDDTAFVLEVTTKLVHHMGGQNESVNHYGVSSDPYID